MDYRLFILLWSGHCRGCRVMEGDIVEDAVLWSGHCRECRVMEGSTAEGAVLWSGH